MIVLGLICVILGVLLGINILFVIGVILLVVGLVLVLLGGLGHPVGGRRYWWLGEQLPVLRCRVAGRDHG